MKLLFLFVVLITIAFIISDVISNINSKDTKSEMFWNIWNDRHNLRIKGIKWYKFYVERRN